MSHKTATLLLRQLLTNVPARELPSPPEVVIPVWPVARSLGTLPTPLLAAVHQLQPVRPARGRPLLDGLAAGGGLPLSKPPPGQLRLYPPGEGLQLPRRGPLYLRPRQHLRSSLRILCNTSPVSAPDHYIRQSAAGVGAPLSRPVRSS